MSRNTILHGETSNYSMGQAFSTLKAETFDGPYAIPRETPKCTTDSRWNGKM